MVGHSALMKMWVEGWVFAIDSDACTVRGRNVNAVSRFEPSFRNELAMFGERQ
jgi:hypothetical protein